MKKTSILDLVSRKLAPFMFLFGFYLFAYGHLSPGGGFQGGVVIASGIILLSVSRGVTTAERLFPVSVLMAVEAVCFLLLIALGVTGSMTGAGFFGNPVREKIIAVPHVSMVLFLNVVIGLKVGAGVSLICMRLLREE